MPECLRCGACCRVQWYLLTKTADLDLDFIRLHGTEVIDYGHSVACAVQTPCGWYDEETGGCTHYENRPRCCREFFCADSEPRRGEAHAFAG